MNNLIKKQLENIPEKTGVYKFLDGSKNILYIGKALNLKSRVSSYFRNNHYDRPQIIKMLPLVRTIDFLVTENEVESLILESSLIKKYKPKFNFELKDDKSFAWIYISTYEKYPSVKIVRSIKKNEYKKGKLFGPYPKGKPVKRIFDYIRKLYPFCTCKNPKKLCLYYHLDLCPGPYQGKISEKDYMKNIENIMKFLKGERRNIIGKLKKEMNIYAKNKDFENAANLRDKINDLEYLSQKITISPFESEDEYINSRYERIRNSLILLSKKLNMEKLSRIECYDVSNINGKFAYGAMSVAINGRLVKEEYRAFKIKTVKEVNDPAMLFEMIERRLKNIQIVNKPDLILIDGGVSQLAVLKKLIPKDIKLLGISKGKHLKKRHKKQKDEFWALKNQKFENIKIDYPFLLMELRDEAHRFGLKYHRRSRGKDIQASELDKIDGVGDKRKKLLIRHFGSVDDIKKASVDEINDILKNRSIAELVKAHVSSE